MSIRFHIDRLANAALNCRRLLKGPRKPAMQLFLKACNVMAFLNIAPDRGNG